MYMQFLAATQNISTACPNGILSVQSTEVCKVCMNVQNYMFLKIFNQTNHF